jgi:hypothetical protein
MFEARLGPWRRGTETSVGGIALERSSKGWLGTCRTSQAWNLGLALLDNGKVQHTEVGIDNAAANGLALANTLAAAAVVLLA